MGQVAFGWEQQSGLSALGLGFTESGLFPSKAGGREGEADDFCRPAPPPTHTQALLLRLRRWFLWAVVKFPGAARTSGGGGETSAFLLLLFSTETILIKRNT